MADADHDVGVAEAEVIALGEAAGAEETEVEGAVHVRMVGGGDSVVMELREELGERR